MRFKVLVIAVCVSWRMGNEYYIDPAPGHENDAVMRYPGISWGEEKISEFGDWTEALRFFASQGSYGRKVEILRVAHNSNGSCLEANP